MEERREGGGYVTYFNTNCETGEILCYSETQTEHQEDVVLWFFRRYPTLLFTPEEVHTATLIVTGAPLTSTRRAITNLTQRGLLEKTDTLRRGSYGKMTHTWKLNRRLRLSQFPRR
jgi:hypothetical protein